MLLQRLIPLLLTVLLLLAQPLSAAPENAGKLRVSADQAGAYIYINGKKKGMTGDEGFTNILLAEGEYQVKVEKEVDDLWVYSAEKSVFIGADTSLKLIFKLSKHNLLVREQRMMAKIREQRGFGKSRYSDHGDGTVTDNKTGLMWKKCSEGLSGNNCSRGKPKYYKWKTAMADAKQVSFAGYSDWRLPTRIELHSLVYCSTGRRGFALDKEGRTQIKGKIMNGRCLGKGYDQPTINQMVFPNTPYWSVWSSSPVAASSSGYMWIIDFRDGNDDAHIKDVSLRVRLVRSGQ